MRSAGSSFSNGGTKRMERNPAERDVSLSSEIQIIVGAFPFVTRGAASNKPQ